VLGALRPGESTEKSLSVRNTQDEAVTIERAETSCHCVNVGRVPVRLEPHETANLPVTFDPSEDPDFAGRLSVEVICYLTDGSISFQTKVNVEVGPPGGYRQD